MDRRPGGGFQKKKFNFQAPVRAVASNNLLNSGAPNIDKESSAPALVNPLGEEEALERPNPASFLKPISKKTSVFPDFKVKQSHPLKEEFVSNKDDMIVNSSNRKRSHSPDLEDDPLDSFMAEIKDQAIQDASAPSRSSRPVNLEEEQEDHMETFLKHRRTNKVVIATRENAGSDEEVYATARAVDQGAEEYDSDDNPIGLSQGVKREVGPLPSIDHDQIDYLEISKNLYKEHPDIQALTEEKVKALRNEEDIQVSGRFVTNPCLAFAHFQFDTRLLSRVANSQYEKPTPIQQQAVPVALQGRDLIGIAQTGSGKTAAYLWPLLVHTFAQAPLEAREGPIALVLAPTRELAHQIGSEARKFAKAYAGRVRIGVASGGFSKLDQFKELRAGVEVLIATPGRLIDLIKMKATNLLRVSFLVVDEADRLLDLGFEPQVCSISENIRPDRQTLLFSATFPNSIAKLTRSLLSDPVRITVGAVGQANLDVEQTYEILSDPGLKWSSLLQRLPLALNPNEARVLIFVSTKIATEQLLVSIVQAGYPCIALHGDLSQAEREDVLARFKSGSCRLLVATDVAARGLDVPGVAWVINYDAARDVDSHVHRVGRTGRAGRRGQAVTFLVSTESHDTRLAAEIVWNLEGASQPVPPHLIDLALQYPKFRKQRQGRGGSRGNKLQGNNSRGGGQSRINNSSSGFTGRPRAPVRHGIGFSGGSTSSSNNNFVKYEPSNP